MSEVSYKLMTIHGGMVEVRGIQVGRFMVRTKMEGELGMLGSPRMYSASLDWRVDHVPSRSSLAEAATFEQALQFADDVSRFAKKDPASKKTELLKKQFGPELLAWIMDAYQHGYRCDFRTWRGECVGGAAA